MVRILNRACQLLAIAAEAVSALVVLGSLWGAAHFHGIGHDHIAEMCVWLGAFGSLVIAIAGTIHFQLAGPRRPTSRSAVRTLQLNLKESR
ncbi:hypothetical protein [Pararhodobacter sp. SW119]|uniref:hypothetical protein n=1 Tax=Pararhodobacter sp. SW119 TaxID=2780075 RepID=UPI001ADF103C|nr:hypothetical protein [Pararhodobacter sp. SW119]